MRSFGARRRGRTGAFHMLEEVVDEDASGLDDMNAANDGIAGSHILSKN